MISLKRYLDQPPAQLQEATISAYRSALKAIADNGCRCCPPTGEALQTELSNASTSLSTNSSVSTIKTTQKKIANSLDQWGIRTEAYFKRKTSEVKEMLTELAGTAEVIGTRDQRYSCQFNEITSNLRAVAELDDLGRIRASVLHSASDIRACVERMVREGKESVAQLQATLAAHRVELDKAQTLASLDPLTGLYNRRKVEAMIDRRLAAGTPFCVVIIDLDNFKQVNDRHGHLAGDELLRQIAAELRQASRSEDIIARWGGDEFILLLDGSLTSAKVKVERMRPWIFGNYDLTPAGAKLSVAVGASIGVAEWSPGESMLQLISRADAELYREKVTHH